MLHLLSKDMSFSHVISILLCPHQYQYTASAQGESLYCLAEKHTHTKKKKKTHKENVCADLLADMFLCLGSKSSNSTVTKACRIIQQQEVTQQQQHSVGLHLPCSLPSSMGSAFVSG